MKGHKRIAVIGSGGQVGSELVGIYWSAYLAEHMVEVISFTRAALAVTNDSIVRTTLSEVKPDWVINASAYTAVDKAESDSVADYSVNAIGPEILARCCAELGAKLIRISTDYVYRGEGNAPPFNSRLSNQKIADVFGLQPDDWKAFLKDMLVELREERGE